MNQESKELFAFFKALERNPRDVQTRHVFADWLDDHDEPELADAQRNWSLERYDAECYLQRFCEKYEAHYEQLLDHLRNGDGYCFGDEDGPWATRNENFWEAVATLTGKPSEELQQQNADQFRCAC